MKILFILEKGDSKYLVAALYGVLKHSGLKIRMFLTSESDYGLKAIKTVVDNT